MDLFDERRKRRESEHAPLAARMRPRSFEEFLGQTHVIGPGKVLREAIEADTTPSLILWGPPGSGKTTLALLIASKTNSHFASISAVSSGVAELRQVVVDSKTRLGLNNQRTLLFIDEIHRLNKAQQDVILPHV
ncbi:AAA family ATPase, partial [SAR202 cluster bacterium AD-804-J14_MRT_500m]|nr:AAA family ATPase [SAR202 cluster bacterium AD-804-J14_MRT_500m]